jgi:hypothetical protein
MPPEKPKTFGPIFTVTKKNKTWVCQTIPPIKAVLLIWPKFSVIADGSVKFMYGPIFNVATVFPS